jgi:hypothetical protein
MFPQITVNDTSDPVIVTGKRADGSTETVAVALQDFRLSPWDAIESAKTVLMEKLRVRVD